MIKRFLHSITKGHVIFVVGIGGLIAELSRHLFTSDTADPTLVLVFAAMLGLPKVLENGNGKKKEA